MIGGGGRTPLLGALFAGLLLVSSSGISSAGGSPLANDARSVTTVRISVSASGGGEYRDLFRLLTEVGRECYARKTEDQTLSLAWNLSWNGSIVRDGPGYRLRVSAPDRRQISGTVTGTSVRDGCDEPDEADPLWVGSDRCDGPLPVLRGVALRPGKPRRAGSTPLVLEGPRFGSPPPPCELEVRNDQLVAHVAPNLGALARAPAGTVVSIPLGTNHPRTGDPFLAVQSCTAVPHTYDGLVWLYDCTDELIWEGALVIAVR